ncbi:hypothetical protein MKW94_003285, partial [Papaver nudicaule]|nr:hypothetical protein [Papaver nudicaule]
MHEYLTAAATNNFLNAAFDGEVDKLKETAAELDRLLGGGIPAVIQNTKDEVGKRAIHYAASQGKVNVLKYLIEEVKLDDVDVKDDFGWKPLSVAVIQGHSAAVKYLLEMGANPELPDDGNYTPLHYAAVKGQNNIIPLLLSKGINVDDTNHFGSSLHYAALFGKHDTVKVLLDHGAN